MRTQQLQKEILLIRMGLQLVGYRRKVSEVKEKIELG